MPPKTIRFSDDLAEKIQAKADKCDRSFSWVVLRACEVAIEGEQVAQGRAFMRGAAKHSRERAMERQRKLNEAKS
jgi:predicted transcriptional regulator